jgi:hypothetical protein
MTTARKRHICAWCGEPIEPGETYHRETVWGEDGPHTWKAHPECDRAWHEVPDDWQEAIADQLAIGDYRQRGCWLED